MQKDFQMCFLLTDQPLPSSDCHMYKEERLPFLWTVMTAASIATHCYSPKDLSRGLSLTNILDLFKIGNCTN